MEKDRMESGIFGHAKLSYRKKNKIDNMKRRKQKHLTEDEVERLKDACETFCFNPCFSGCAS